MNSKIGFFIAGEFFQPTNHTRLPTEFYPLSHSGDEERAKVPREVGRLRARISEPTHRTYPIGIVSESNIYEPTYLPNLPKTLYIEFD